MTTESETSKALTVLRDTVGSKFNATQQVSPTGARLVRAFRNIGWRPNRVLSVDEILQLSAVLICLDVLSQDMGKVTLGLYRKTGPTSKELLESDEHWLAGLLASRPNEQHTWQEFIEILMLHLALAQNAFIAKRIEGRLVSELIPCMPARTTTLAVEPSDGSRGFFAYKVDRFSPQERIPLWGLPEVFLPGEFIHLRGRTFDGLLGYSNFEAGARTFGLANEIVEYSTRLYENDGAMRGVFSKPGENGDAMSEVAFQRLRDQLSELMTNMRRHGTPIVLEEGMTFESIVMQADQAEASKSRDASIVDVARTFRIPPHKIMHLINVKYENMETLEKSYVQDTLIPYARRIEQRLGLALLTREEQSKYFLQFDRRAMMLNDFQMLAEVTKSAGQLGALLQDEIREVFGWNPLPGNAGRVRIIPANYHLVDETNKVIIPAGAQPAGDDSKDDTEKKPAKKPKKDIDEDNPSPAILRFPTLVGEKP